MRAAATLPYALPPPRDPSPQGGGEQTERVATIYYPAEKSRLAKQAHGQHKARSVAAASFETRRYAIALRMTAEGSPAARRGHFRARFFFARFTVS